MMAKASMVFHAGGRPVASIGNRSLGRPQGRRVFLTCAGQPDTWTSWPARTERSALRTAGTRGKRSASRLDFAATRTIAISRPLRLTRTPFLGQVSERSQSQTSPPEIVVLRFSSLPNRPREQFGIHVQADDS